MHMYVCIPSSYQAFCHPKFRRGDKESVALIKSVQAEQGAKNVAQAKRQQQQQGGVGGVYGHIRAHAHLQGHDPFHHNINPRVQPPVIIPAADAPPGALTGALSITGAAATHGVGLADPIVAARLRAAALLEVEEETLRIQHLERQLQQAEARAAVSAATANSYDGYVGVGAGAGAPRTGLQSLAARNAASALTRRYSGTGSGLAAMEHAAAPAAAPATGATGYGQSLADMHYAQAAQGLPLNVAVSAPAAAQAPTAQVPAAAGDVNLATAPPSIFGTGSQIYEQSSPLEREIMLQIRYKHLLNIQSKLQHNALVSRQHQLQLEEQQYLAAHQPPHASLTAAASVGAGIGAAGHGQLLPQQAVDNATSMFWLAQLL